MTYTNEKQQPPHDSDEMTAKVLTALSIYDKVGITSRDRLDDAPTQYHPKNIMPDFKSVIVLSREPKDISKEMIVGKFHKTIGMIAAQDSVIAYLARKGYKTHLLGSRAKNVSLPRLGERAGVGQLSPFNSLAVKGHGLRTVLSAIITDASLQPSPLVTDACLRRDVCLKKCKALDTDGVFDRTKCSSCGACVKTCPVES